MPARVWPLSILILLLATPTLADEISLEFSWKGVPSCRSISGSPEMTIRNYPKQAKRVMLILTQEHLPRGGQEVDLPADGRIPAGAAVTMGPCNPGMYRWTAIFKSDAGQVLAETHVDTQYP